MEKQTPHSDCLAMKLGLISVLKIPSWPMKCRFMIINVDVWRAMAATRIVFLLMLMCYILTRVFENLSDYNRTLTFPHPHPTKTGEQLTSQTIPTMHCLQWSWWQGNKLCTAPSLFANLNTCEFQRIKCSGLEIKVALKMIWKKNSGGGVLNITNRTSTCNKQRVC